MNLESPSKSESPRDASRYFFRASAEDFKKIPGCPVAYWVSEKIISTFDEPKIGEIIITEGQNKTANNDIYVRYIWEVKLSDVGKDNKWLVYAKGGDFRKWYGNLQHLIDWSESARKHYRKDISCRIISEEFWYKKGITWTDITSSGTAFRYLPENTTFDMSGPTAFFSDASQIPKYLSLLNSKYVKKLLPILNPTLHAQLRDIKSIPMLVKETDQDFNSGTAKLCIYFSSADWNNYETSWDFSDSPLLRTESPWPVSEDRKEVEGLLPNFGNGRGIKGKTLEESWKNWRAFSEAATARMKELEEENNKIFIHAYGLQDELEPDVPLKEITLTCNPWYRFSSDEKSAEELWALMREETLKEFISYAVGCMFGRYSLDKPGLILANQGETADDYYRILEPRMDANERESGRERPGMDANKRECGVGEQQVDAGGRELGGLKNSNSENISVHSRPFAVNSQDSRYSFAVDEQNVIPVLEKDWFTDDITERFYEFLRVTFGKEHFSANLAFLEEALGKDVRKYFLKDFYGDHVKRYKKRPIYWLFTSPKGGFQALIYMHRYRPDTVSVILNDYVREYRAKLAARVEHLQGVEASGDAAKGAKTRAIKEIESLRKIIDELDAWEREVLYPLASERKEIDLDDGVKVNYPKFDGAVKKIPGLDAQEE